MAFFDTIYSSLLWSIPLILFFFLLFLGKTNYKLITGLRWFIIPATVALSLLAINHDYHSQFYTIKDYPPDDVVYVYNWHKAVRSGDQIMVFMWITEYETDREYIYEFVLDEETKRKMDEMREGNQGRSGLYRFEFESERNGADWEYEFEFEEMPRIAQGPEKPVD